MKVLSLFDGISCGYVALERAGIPIDVYYASEIDKHAIKVATTNHPDIIEIGDVNDWKERDLWEIDMVIWWFPCQAFSLAWKQWNFDDPRWQLFFRFLEIIRHYKPKYFLGENVKMNKKYIETINKCLATMLLPGEDGRDDREVLDSKMKFKNKKTGEIREFDCVMIDSSKLSAQRRKRLYRVGKLQPDGTYSKIEIPQPGDKGLYLKDVLQDEVDVKYCLSQQQVDMIAKWGWFEDPLEKMKWINDKMGTLTTHCGKMSNWIKLIRWRPAMPYEPGHRTLHFTHYYDKCPTLTTTCASGDQKNVVLNGDVIRKLTPEECELLQNLDPGYTSAVSDTQRYIQLWNGWTCNVIAHIFICIKQQDENS